MAISFIGSATGTNTATMPAHQAGDLIIVFAYRDGSTTPPSLVSGYSNLFFDTGANTNSHRVSYRIATSSSHVVGTWTNATLLCVQVYRGVDQTTPLGAHQMTTNAITTLTFGALTLQKTDNTSWVAGFVGYRHNTMTVETPPTGMVNRSTAISANPLDEIAGHDTNGPVSSFAAKTVTVTGSGGAFRWRSHTVEIRAAIGGSVNDYGNSSNITWTHTNFRLTSGAGPSSTAVNIGAASDDRWVAAFVIARNSGGTHLPITAATIGGATCSVYPTEGTTYKGAWIIANLTSGTTAGISLTATGIDNNIVVAVATVYGTLGQSNTWGINEFSDPDTIFYTSTDDRALALMLNATGDRQNQATGLSLNRDQWTVDNLTGAALSNTTGNDTITLNMGGATYLGVYVVFIADDPVVYFTDTTDPILTSEAITLTEEGSQSILGVPIGVADALRQIIVIVSATGFTAPSTIAPYHVTDVTIGGVAATCTPITKSGVFGDPFFMTACVANVPTGTTADIVVNDTGTEDVLYVSFVGVWSTSNVNPVPVLSSHDDSISTFDAPASSQMVMAALMDGIVRNGLIGADVNAYVYSGYSAILGSNKFVGAAPGIDLYADDGTSNPNAAEIVYAIFQEVGDGPVGVLVKVWSGSTWVESVVKRYNGVTWDVVDLKVFNGSTWN